MKTSQGVQGKTGLVMSPELGTKGISSGQEGGGDGEAGGGRERERG